MSEESRLWREIGVCECPVGLTERFGHAGISDDGRYCLIEDAWAKSVYILWDVWSRRVVWSQDSTAKARTGTPPIKRRGSPYHLRAHLDGAPIDFRLFGPEQPKRIVERVDLGWRIDCGDGFVDFVSLGDATTVSRTFDALSGDWFYASFAATSPIAVVVEPYETRFFAHDIDVPAQK